MKNRFSSSNKISYPKKIMRYLSAALFIALFIIFIAGVDNVSETTEARQQESLETAIQRDIVHCYAVEGTYPPSLDYIKQHYGLSYNDKKFFVDYQPIGSNVLPNVTVIRLDEKEAQDEPLQK